MRLAASGWVSPRRFLPVLPPDDSLQRRTGHLQLEIVTHCWRYAHLLAYQLSSLVLHAPTRLSVRMTVCYSPEDEATSRLLAFFGAQAVPHVTWNWCPLDPSLLLRRAIGRNRAALQTPADWIWFTDCDLIFGPGCLDGLADQLQGRNDRLVFPRVEHCSKLLGPTDPLLQKLATPRLIDIDPALFSPVSHDRATGPLQIAHGDLARQVGYCDAIEYYQRPVSHWQKTYEDRAFRWLLRTLGTPLEVPGVFRIKHSSKGRYRPNRATAWVRETLRRLQSGLVRGGR